MTIPAAAPSNCVFLWCGNIKVDLRIGSSARWSGRSAKNYRATIFSKLTRNWCAIWPMGKFCSRPLGCASTEGPEPCERQANHNYRCAPGNKVEQSRVYVFAHERLLINEQ